MNTPEMSDSELLKVILDSEPPRRAHVRLNAKANRAAIQFVAGVIPNRPTLPILSTVRCFTNGSTKLTGTDLDIFITAELPEKSIAEGTCLLPKSALVSAFKTAKQIVEINASGGAADLHTDGFKQNVPLLPIEAFPPVPKFSRDTTLRLSASAFKQALKLVLCAISTDESRYVLNGIYLEVHPEHVNLIATDGRRLHTTQIPRSTSDKQRRKQIDEAQSALDLANREFEAAQSAKSPELEQHRKLRQSRREALDQLSSPAGYIIPTKAVHHLLRMPLDKENDTLFIVAGTDKGCALYASFMCGQFLLETKLIDGNYPNYRQVIPVEFKERITVNPAVMLPVLRYAATVCTDKSNSVKLTFTRHNLNVRGNSPEKGEAKADIPIHYLGSEGVIAFNPRYLIEMCDAFKSGPITLCYIDELSPIVIEQDKTRAVIMPMRLS